MIQEFTLDTYGDETLPNQVRVVRWINFDINSIPTLMILHYYLSLMKQSTKSSLKMLHQMIFI